MNTHGSAELRQLLTRFKGVYLWVALFSLFLNLLMLTGPVYMMQVYDRVLSSGSEATLVALSLVVVFLYTVMGGLDIIRSRVLTRIAGQFQQKMDARVFTATMNFASESPKSPPHPGLQDLEALQRLMSSPAVHACFDLPWVPLFMLALWAFHPLLFLLALIGGSMLVIISILSQYFGYSHNNISFSAAEKARHISDEVRKNLDVLRAMGMLPNALKKWEEKRKISLEKGVDATDVGGGFTSISRTMRLILQSAMLGAGAWLVLQGGLSSGAMMAASVLLGRALAPIEALIGQWTTIQRGVKSWSSLKKLLIHVAPPQNLPALAKPKSFLDVKEATVIPPGERQAILRMMNFSLRPGNACGVIGPSGAGKSSLAKALTGLWSPAAGLIKLGGIPLDQYGADGLGKHIGYLPQSVTLFDGSIAENIARLADNPDMNAVRLAAQRSGVLPLIESFPDGFETQVRSDQNLLSGGQVQRIGFARALYGDPTMVILDEPNSNLDNAGNLALNRAIADLKKRGKIVLIMAHRPMAIQECDVLLMIENGVRKAFGPKETVLQKVAENHSQIRQPRVSGGQL